MKDLTTYAITTMICFTIVLASIVIAINTNKTETVNTEIENCEHDFVITSKYDFWRSSYKTISKCTKCGKVVE